MTRANPGERQITSRQGIKRIRSNEKHANSACLYFGFTSAGLGYTSFQTH